MARVDDRAPVGQTKKKPSRRMELVGGLFGSITGTISTLVLGLLISILVEWVGITAFWPEDGYKHSQDMFNTEVTYLREDFRESLFTSTPEELDYYVTTFTAVFYKYGIEETGLAGYLRRLNQRPQESDPWYVVAGRKIQDYLLAIVFVSQTYAVRLTILILSFPLFFLVLSYSLVKGLNARAIRTWCGGRESGTRYHLGKYTLLASFSLPFIIYLAYPDTVHPSYVLLPSAAVIGLMTYYVVSNFKKYF